MEYNIFQLTIDPYFECLTESDRAIIRDRIKMSFNGVYWINKDSCLIKTDYTDPKVVYDKIFRTDYTRLRCTVTKIDTSENYKGVYGFHSVDLWRDFIGNRTKDDKNTSTK